MKRLLILILLTTGIYSQTPLDTCKNAFIIARIKLDSNRNALNNVVKQNHNLEQQIVNYKQVITELQLSKTALESQLRLYQKSEQAQTKPLFRWQGFYIGAGTGLTFDSVIVKNTIISRLWDKVYIFAKPYVQMGGFLINGVLKIPLNDKLFIGGEVGYRIF